MGAFFLLIMLLFPVITAASRRAVDAGFDQRWAGWPFAGIVFGFGLIDTATGPMGDNVRSWMLPTGIVLAVIGVLMIVLVLMRATTEGPSEYEVSQ